MNLVFIDDHKSTVKTVQVLDDRTTTSTNLFRISMIARNREGKRYFAIHDLFQATGEQWKTIPNLIADRNLKYFVFEYENRRLLHLLPPLSPFDFSESGCHRGNDKGISALS